MLADAIRDDKDRRQSLAKSERHGLAFTIHRGWICRTRASSEFRLRPASEIERQLWDSLK
jgi:hypothetical protein